MERSKDTKSRTKEQQLCVTLLDYYPFPYTDGNQFQIHKQLKRFPPSKLCLRLTPEKGSIFGKCFKGF